MPRDSFLNPSINPQCQNLEEILLSPLLFSFERSNVLYTFLLDFYVLIYALLAHIFFVLYVSMFISINNLKEKKEATLKLKSRLKPPPCTGRCKVRFTLVNNRPVLEELADYCTV